MAALTLASHHLCPYVQRAAIALAEKGVPFDRVYVDLADKPDWFRKVSPLGKVPLLRVGAPESETVIFESAVILEFLEETQPSPLHPSDPLRRARHRAFIEFGSATLNAISKFYAATSELDLRVEAKTVAAMFDRVEAELARRDGDPWFGGEAFSLVDAVFAPVFRYFDVFDGIADFGILAGLPRVAEWRKALAGRPSVIAAVGADYQERLATFLRARNSAISRLIPTLEPASALR